MPGKGTPWTEAELDLVREAKDRWDQRAVVDWRAVAAGTATPFEG